MSSKSKLLHSLLAIPLVFSNSCGLLNEPVANFGSSSSNISSGAGCLRDSLETLGHFFSGEAAQVSVDGAWVCVDESLELFSKKVRGENPNYYTARELANFIESQVLDPGARVSNPLLVEIMHLKQMMVGGAEDKLTVKELSDLRSFTGKLRILFVQMQPLMKFLSGNWDAKSLPPQKAREKIKEVEAEFALKIKALWPTLSAAYNLQNIQALADALLTNFPNSQGLKSFRDWVTQYLPLVLSAKKTILGFDSNVMTLADWPRLLSVLPKLYSRYMYYDYFLSEGSFFWGENLLAFQEWIQDISSNLSLVFSTRGAGTPVGISVSEINSMIDSLNASNLLVDFLSPATLKSLVPIAISRFLTPPAQRLAGKKETDLGPVALETFNNEFKAFMQGQIKLSDLWAQKNQWTHAELRASFQGASGGAEELSRIFQSPNSYSFDAKGRMHIDAGLELPYDQDSAMKVNLIRSLTRIAIRAYAKDLNRANNATSLTKDEVLVDAFTELRPILVQAELIEADNDRFAKNRFLEANLFTPVGNGDNVLDFKEGAGIMLMIWSGINLAKEFEPAIKAACLLPNSNPVMYNVTCSLEQIRLQVPSIATSIPLMALHLQTVPAVDATQMLYETLRATGWVAIPANAAKISDLGLMLHLMQYMESIFRRWDTNKDKILNKAEAMVAEPVFRPLLAEISGQTSTSVLRAGFAYILIYQQNPADDFIKFVFFMNDEASWNIQVNRPKLSKVLGFIADEMAKP